MRQLIGFLMIIGGIVLFIVSFKYSGLGVVISIIGCAIADPVWDSKEMRT
jgi:hypothetical protein